MQIQNMELDVRQFSDEKTSSEALYDDILSRADDFEGAT